MTENEPVDLTGDELEAAIEDNSALIVDFWAEWCSACGMMEPVLESLAEDYGDKVFFGKLNVGEDRETAMEYQVSGIPTFLLFKDGEMVEKVVGAVPEEELEEKIEGLVE